MPEFWHCISRAGVLQASGSRVGVAAMAVAGLSLEASPSAESVQLAEQVLTSALSMTTDQLQIIQGDLEWLCKKSAASQQAIARSQSRSLERWAHETASYSTWPDVGC